MALAMLLWSHRKVCFGTKVCLYVNLEMCLQSEVKRDDSCRGVGRDNPNEGQIGPAKC